MHLDCLSVNLQTDCVCAFLTILLETKVASNEKQVNWIRTSLNDAISEFIGRILDRDLGASKLFSHKANIHVVNYEYWRPEPLQSRTTEFGKRGWCSIVGS